jgi:hypothetical protein
MGGEVGRGVGVGEAAVPAVRFNTEAPPGRQEAVCVAKKSLILKVMVIPSELTAGWYTSIT